MKKMTKKELEAFIEKKFGEIDNQLMLTAEGGNTYFLGCLCHKMPRDSGWNEYWDKINTEHCNLISRYFTHDFTYQEKALLRLITLHLFVRHKFPERKKKRGVKR